jgi:hypothetical protein
MQECSGSMAVAATIEERISLLNDYAPLLARLQAIADEIAIAIIYERQQE